MEILVSVIQVVIGLCILNVWLLRPEKATAWRGQQARNLKEEFGVYGLPPWFMGMVGFFKILFAVLLSLGVWLPSLTRPAALGMAVLMVGAVLMHLKVKDPLKKCLPAFTLLILCIVVALAAA